MLIGNANEIANLKEKKMREYLENEFKKSSKEENVSVKSFKKGYLIIDGKIMATVNEEGLVELIENGEYTLATNDDWIFNENNDGTATLVTYKKAIKGKIVIPTEVKNKETNKIYIVTALGDDIFNYGTNITSVNMSGAVWLKTIGNRTFANCTNLEINVPKDLPKSIEKISNSAFLNCTNLVGNIDEILASKITLGRGTFANCPNLTGSIQNVFNQMFYKEEDGTPNRTVIEDGQFSGFSGLTGELVIPNYITKIGKNAFSSCSGITSLSFEAGSNCTQIDDWAFYQTKGMKNSVVLPDSITQIGASCFYESGITGVKLPANLQKLGVEAFYASELSGTLTIPKTLKVIPYQAFAFAKITTLNFEADGINGTKVIEDSAFCYSRNMTNINFPNTLTDIKFLAFTSCGMLSDISLPNSLTNIEEGAFSGCARINIAHWPANLTTVEKLAFKNCNNLKTLPDTTSLVTIGEESFINCTALGQKENNESTDLIEYLQKSKITNLGTASFKNCKYLKGNYEGNIKNKNGDGITIGSSAFTGTAVTKSAELNITGSIINANEYNGVTEFRKNGEIITKIEIPTGITSIEEAAFAGCTSITSVSIPKTVTSIEANAFQNCTSLQTVVFESGNTALTIIPDYCFQGCTKLNSVQNIPNNVTKFGQYSFGDCSNLSSIKLPEKLQILDYWALGSTGLTSIDLPQSLTTIGTYCFYGTPITKITIPDSVTSAGVAILEMSKIEEITVGKGITQITNYLFANCRELKKITFRGNITSIGRYGFNNCSKLPLSGINGLDWKKINSIEKQAFNSCTSLTGKVQLSSSCVVDENALTNCPLVFYK